MAADKNKKKHPEAGNEPEVTDESEFVDESAGRGKFSGEAEERKSGEGGGDKESTEPIVRDKRRIDPETGEARVDPVAQDISDQLTEEDLAKLLEGVDSDSAASADSPQGGTSADANDHLDDLKRVQAEYANYRKRVERDRLVAREIAVVEVLSSILPVLDDLDLAHSHGDLEGSPLEMVAQKIRTTFGRYGLKKVGEVGEPFDPKLHEAIAQLPNADVSIETIADVVQPGYTLGERLLRPAKVAVSVPEG